MFLSTILALLVIWFLAFVVFHVLGWFIHILLVVAVVAILWRVIQGKNPFK